MIQIRIATAEDTAIIAQLHAKSWQQHYRGILSDDYLKHEVEEDRLQVWTKRFSEVRPNQHVLLAEINGQAGGFACIVGDEDTVWGSLLDNIHVSTQLQGKGIGTILMKAAAKWSFENFPNKRFYLFVYQQNEKALQFYKNLGGVIAGREFLANPDGSKAMVVRVVWEYNADIG